MLDDARARIAGLVLFAIALAVAPGLAQQQQSPQAVADLTGEWGMRQHEDQPERGPGLVGARPAQRSAQVVVLAVEQLRLFDDHPGGPFGIVGFGDGKEVGAMRSRQLSRLTCMIEILLAKLADRLQLPVSGPGAPPFGDHQRLVHQLGQQVEQFDLLEGRISADCYHNVEGETTREHR